jgi:hypothetical protein
MSLRIAAIVIAMLASLELVSGATIFSAAGPDVASVSGALNDFRAELGVLNPNQPVSFSGGRREINWDAVPAAATAPNPFPGAFFNGSTPGRARGVIFETPGTGFLVSIASEDDEFAAFSPVRIFEAESSTMTDVLFRLPSDQTTFARTRGFGVIFLDVDEDDSASMEFFNIAGISLGKWFAPAASGDRTFSFLGVTLDAATVAKVRIVSGSATDAVKMDDFLYGEPTPTPEPATGLLLSAAVGALVLLRRRYNSA